MPLESFSVFGISEDFDRILRKWIYLEIRQISVIIAFHELRSAGKNGPN